MLGIFPPHLSLVNHTQFLLRNVFGHHLSNLSTLGKTWLHLLPLALSFFLRGPHHVILAGLELCRSSDSERPTCLYLQRESPLPVPHNLEYRLEVGRNSLLGQFLVEFAVWEALMAKDLLA